MSTQDDVAVLLRAVGKGGTVEERVRVLVSKLGQLMAGMKLTVTDANALTALAGGAAVLGENVEAIVRAVAGNSEVPHYEPQPEPQPWPDVEDEPEDEEPEPEPPEPEPVPHKRKPVRRKR